MGTNQGESSNESSYDKKPFMMASVENKGGDESGESPENEWGAASGESAPFTPPANEINISASEENLAAKYKTPSVNQDQGAGAGQYE